MIHTLCRDIDAERISLDDERARIVLCYPRHGDAECLERIEEARRVGVEALLSYGNVVLARGLRVVGKGHAAVVVLAVMGSRIVALKVRRMDSKRYSLEDECRLLERASRIGIAPQVYACTRNVIAREFVDGPTLREYLRECMKRGDRDAVKRVIIELLRASWMLDKVGIDLEEIANPLDQVVVECGDPCRPRFIDFESGKLRSAPNNFCKVLGFVVGRSVEGVKISDLLGVSTCVEELRALARRYKESRSEDAVRRCIEVLEHGCGHSRG